MSAPTGETHDHGAFAAWFEERPINKNTVALLTRAIHERLAFVGLDWAKLPDGKATRSPIKMLDYACGSGFMTRIFAPFVTSVNAIDLSSHMIDRFKTNTPTFDIPAEKVAAVVGDLLTVPGALSLGGEEYHGYELITVSAALHHFPSAEDAVKILAGRLTEGGVFFVQDLYASDAQRNNGNEEPAKKHDGKRPRGYTEEEMRGIMEAAGLTDFRMEVLPDTYELEIPSGEIVGIQCFIARATKLDE